MSLLAVITWDDSQFYNNIVHKFILYVCMFVQLWDSMFYKSNVLIVPHFHLIVALCLYPFIRILYVKIRMNVQQRYIFSCIYHLLPKIFRHFAIFRRNV